MALCRHGVPTCRRCKRAARLRELLRFIRGAELAAGQHLPLCAVDFDPQFRQRERRRRNQGADDEPLVHAVMLEAIKSARRRRR